MPSSSTSSKKTAFSGWAEPLATRQFRQNACDAGTLHPSRRGHIGDVEVNPLGLGTYLGAMDVTTDLAVVKAVVKAVEGGVQVIDTAINYRGQRAERSVGEALRQLFLSGKAKRESLFLCSKAGFVPYDGEAHESIESVYERDVVGAGLAASSDLVAGCHCLAPRFLENQLHRSLSNLGVETLDLYYLHNPETQLEEYPQRILLERLFDAFEVLEKARQQGRLRWYGLATWDGLREPPQSQSHLPLQKIVEVAKAASGDGDCGLKVVQAPLNLAMPELCYTPSQSVEETDGEMRVVSTAEAAKALGLQVVTSGPLFQGQILEGMPSFITKHFSPDTTPAQISLQFALSSPHVDLTLVGAKRPEHVDENLAVLKEEALTPQAMQGLLRSLVARH